MPDIDRPDPPADWTSAFAALPAETPPPGGWKRVERALDASVSKQARRRRWPGSRVATAIGALAHGSASMPAHRRQWAGWLAAAAIGAVVLVPALRMDDEASRGPTRSGDTSLAAQKRPRVDPTRPPTAASKRPETRVAAATPPAQRASRDEVATTSPKSAPDAAQRIAATAPAPRATPDARADELRAQVAALQSESAQLEALLALARDDRVASASGAALAVEFDRRIGRIDASLSQPGLADDDRAALWQARVSTMRELAGIETTQRWLTASGERYDGALVSVD